eukprot:NODE_1552_length_1463_cov_54.372754_g1472_i0.p1 GENE.NODE_1552_length_1463_cov_54.372754_g1472_i0~~NODE_1552_length_1463_cov_54.372754_g1472_i0.p1  ORF type:complete len:424 (+),score=60.15 NODE_1552_length_1463_cov_54.372754_g1472_i0:62-1333(+)
MAFLPMTAMLRVCPLPAEEHSTPLQCVSPTTIQCREDGHTVETTCHHIFWSVDPKQVPCSLPHSTQEHLHHKVCAAGVQAAGEGSNVACVVFGQRHSGKTYSLFGHMDGIAPKLCGDLLPHLSTHYHSCTYSLALSVVHREIALDLLEPIGLNAQAWRDRADSQDVTTMPAKSFTDIETLSLLLDRGMSNYAVLCQADPLLEAMAHVCLHLKCTQQGKSVSVTCLEVADQQDLPVEPTYKKSYSAFHCMLNGEKPPDSCLTHLLKKIIGGNCETTYLATVSPSHVNRKATVATLKLLQRASTIRNHPKPVGWVKQDPSPRKLHLQNDPAALLSRLRTLASKATPEARQELSVGLGAFQELIDSTVAEAAPQLAKQRKPKRMTSPPLGSRQASSLRSGSPLIAPNSPPALKPFLRRRSPPMLRV